MVTAQRTARIKLAAILCDISDSLYAVKSLMGAAYESDSFDKEQMDERLTDLQANIDSAINWVGP